MEAKNDIDAPYKGSELSSLEDSATAIPNLKATSQQPTKHDP